jgi:hypothetical protein
MSESEMSFIMTADWSYGKSLVVSMNKKQPERIVDDHGTTWLVCLGCDAFAPASSIAGDELAQHVRRGCPPQEKT